MPSGLVNLLIDYIAPGIGTPMLYWSFGLSNISLIAVILITFNNIHYIECETVQCSVNSLLASLVNFHISHFNYIRASSPFFATFGHSLDFFGLSSGGGGTFAIVRDSLKFLCL